MAKCTECGGSGEVTDDAGNVVECPAPGCFYGSIKISATCPKCNGTGEQPD